jgi:tetratricopeptide (TPR) repeat protein
MMNKRRALHPSRLLWLIVILLGVITISWTTLLSKVTSNMGLLLLARSLTSSDLLELGSSGSDVFEQEQAQRWLQVATTLNPNNRGAWRGLGLALTALGLGRTEEALAAWRNASATANEFIVRGHQARNARQFTAALNWYQRATTLQPELADCWYYQGLAYQDLGEWPAARQALQRAVQAPIFDLVGYSTRYYRLGMVARFHIQPPLMSEALDAFTAAIQLNDFSSGYEAADSHYQRGNLVEQTNQSLALQDYQKALELYSQHYWAHLLLGRLLYKTSRDVSKAEAEMYRALTLWPDDGTRKWPYRFLGDMYRQAGLIDKAHDAYQAALRLDPTDNSIKSILAQIISSN